MLLIVNLSATAGVFLVQALSGSDGASLKAGFRKDDRSIVKSGIAHL
jgi:hypothetical protein